MTYKQLRAAIRAMDKCFAPALEAKITRVDLEFNIVEITTTEEVITFAEYRKGKRMVWEPVVWRPVTKY